MYNTTYKEWLIGQALSHTTDVELIFNTVDEILSRLKTDTDSTEISEEKTSQWFNNTNKMTEDLLYALNVEGFGDAGKL